MSRVLKSIHGWTGRRHFAAYGQRAFFLAFGFFGPLLDSAGANKVVS